jgi:hemoglobin
MVGPRPIDLLLRINRIPATGGIVTKLAALACVMIACGGKPAPQTTTKSDVKPQGGKATATSPAPKAPNELYDRLGGQRAIVAVVDDFIGRVAADERIKLRFFNTDIPKLKLLLVEFVCMATGGPCKYSGQDMETSHAGMDVVDLEFTALVEDLSATLDKFKVPAKEKGELLGALGPLQPLIVVPKDRLKPVSDAQLAKATAVVDKVTDKQARELMQGAILAAKRGQRNYADQLFSRVELIVGAQVVAAAAPAFREGAPPRIETAVKQMPKDAIPQPKIVGSSDEDNPSATQLPGSLKGTITVDGKPLDGVGLVMLYPENGKYPKRTPKTRVVEQRNKQFSPRLLAIPPGSTVAFPNYDGFYHNVFSTSATQPFDIGLYKDGQSREMKFGKTGLVRLGCNVHAKMASFIFVIDAPAYVPVEGAQEFNFKSLAPGKYKARVWSERSSEPAESEVVIKTGVNTMTFDVKGDAEKGPSKDKFGNTRQPAQPAPKK